jgi:O-antigen ligase
MDALDKKYTNLILLHIVIGVLIYLAPLFSKLYSILIILLGIFIIVKSKNKNNEVLLFAGYIVGSEVLLRMTGGTISYEFSKYGVILFLILGMYFSGFSKNAFPYWFFLILLIPSVIIATSVLSFDTDIRKRILFNISGPVCLGIASIYCYQRRISLQQLNTVLLCCGLPVISTVVYLILYTPDLKKILISTGSNFQTSGGFGPNQVATILGLGMFIFFSRILLTSKTRLFFFLNVVICLFITYRGLITFSRGGMLTGFIMMFVLVFFLYWYSNSTGRVKINSLIILSIFLMLFIWLYTSNATGGLIEKRYANQDAAGKTKSSTFTGRETIFQSEFNYFLDNPIFGVGVAKGAELRKEDQGETIASHNEISRMLAEHGLLGIIGLLILLFTPMILYFNNKQNIYIFCFIAFWLLTINHAAMRIAAPAFIYSLSLLKVYFDEENSVRRE